MPPTTPPPSNIPNPSTILILGAGVFGLSTALHLRRSHPTTHITLIDRTAPPSNPNLSFANAGASNDLNKIIRADYPDLLYMRLALEAQGLWRGDPLFRGWYHECGILFAEGGQDAGFGKACLENYEALGMHDSGADVLSTAEARARFPVFKDANWTDAKEFYYSPRGGWAEADGAMRKVFEAVLGLGLEFVEGTVQKLILDEGDGSCLGVRVVDNGGETRDILADRTILCVGANTAKVLADSAPEWEELQVNDRMVAAAAVQCTARYPAEYEEVLAGAPVQFISLWHTRGEGIPPCRGRLKFNCEVSFTRTLHHDGLGREISVPLPATGEGMFREDVPKRLRQELDSVVRNMYGEGVPEIEIKGYRMCWDAVSPDLHFIIDHHPACHNLVIASAGSFHSWKFLPTIGKYVVQRVFGELDSEIARRWAWDRESKGRSRPHIYFPSRDIKDLGHFEGWPWTGVEDESAW